MDRDATSAGGTGRPAIGRPRPFHAPIYQLGTLAGEGPVTLEPLAPGEAETLGRVFAAMEPWRTYGTRAQSLAGFFATEEPECARRAIRVAGGLAGAVVVRSPWLHGPYLQFLGLVPGRQGGGLGAAALSWMEREAPEEARNLWLCVSAINTRARAFYERHGFRPAATLDGLAADHMDEILMRKRIAR